MSYFIIIDDYNKLCYYLNNIVLNYNIVLDTG